MDAALLVVLALTQCACGPESPEEGGPRAGDAPGSAAKAGAAGGEKRLDDRDWVAARVKRLREIGRGVSAARLLLEVEEQHPSSTGDRHAEIAQAYHEAGAFLVAEKHAREALKRSPNHALATYVLGDALRESAREDEAKKLLRSSSLLEAKSSLARILFREGDVESSLALFQDYFAAMRAAKREVPSIATVEYGRALRAAKRYREAADVLTVRLELEPWNVGLYSELSTTMFRLKKRETGKLLQSLYSAHNQDAFEHEAQAKLRAKGMEDMALSQEAVNRERQRRYSEAFEAHALANAETRDSRVVRYYAEFLRSMSRDETALRLLEQRLASGVTLASDLWLLRAELELKLGKTELALQSIARSRSALSAEGNAGGAARGQAPDHEVDTIAAECLLGAGRFDEAIERAEAALRSQPGYAEAHFVLGRADAARNRHAQALARFDAAIKAGPRDSGEVLRAQSRSLSAMNKRAEASQALRAAGARLAQSAGLIAELVALSPPAQRQPLMQHREVIAKLEEQAAMLRAEIAKTSRDGDARLYRALGEIYLKLRDPRAQTTLLYAAREARDDPQLWRNVAGLITRNEDVFFRLQWMRRVLDQLPDDLQALQTFASLYTSLGLRPDEAKRCAQRLYELRPDAVSTRLLAEAHLGLGDRDGALRTLTEGVSKYPTDATLEARLTELRDEAAR